MKRIVLALLASCFAFGCHNVDLPDVAALGGDGGNLSGTGPSLSIGNLAGKKLSIDSQISFDAQDVDGVAGVSLSCSGIILFTWTSAPYVAQVNLAPCQALGTPTGDGSGALNVVLTLTATDSRGNSAHQDFTVTIDPSAAALSTDLPELVRPGAPLSFEVVSDRALRGVPVVKVGGVQADVQPASTANAYVATLAQLPLLGVDAYTGDAGSAPSAVLEDFDRALDVIIDAQALNGNASSLTRTVRLTRILWDDPLPAPEYPAPNGYALPTSLPTAGARGLTVPLDFTLVNNPQGRVEFLSAFYGSDGGITTQSNLIDGGFRATAIDALGNLEVEPFNDTGTEIFFVDSESGATTAGAANYLPTPNTQFEGLLCGASGGCFGSAALTCLGADGTLINTDIGLDGGANGLPVVTSKNALLAMLTDCGSNFTWSVVQPHLGVSSPIEGQAVYSPDPVNWVNCTRQNLEPLPMRDGTFAILDDLLCDNPGSGIVQADLFTSENLWIGSDGSHLGTYAGTLPAFPGSSSTVLTGIPGGKLVTLSPGTPNSRVQFWPPDAGAPDPAEDVVIPGFFQYPPSVGTTPAIPAPRDTVLNANGFAVLVATSQFTRAVVQFDPQFRPRWIYRYPRLAQPGSLQLVGSQSSPVLYLVDSFNQRVVAIQP